MIVCRAVSPPLKVPSSLRARRSSFPFPFNYQGATGSIQSSQDLIAVNCIRVRKMHNQRRYFLIHNLLRGSFLLNAFIFRFLDIGRRGGRRRRRRRRAITDDALSAR